jgi:hypothetical protein
MVEYDRTATTPDAVNYVGIPAYYLFQPIRWRTQNLVKIE